MSLPRFAIRTVPRLLAGAVAVAAVASAAPASAAPASATPASATPASAATSWRVQAVPVPGPGGGNMTGVSCPVSGVCTAVGSYVQTNVGEETLAEQWTGGAWHVQPTPNPGGTDGIEQLNGVSCLSASDCTAAGDYSTATVSETTLIEHWNGTAWSVVATPDPAGTSVAELDAVSCFSASDCTATGQSLAGSGSKVHTVPLAEHWNGTTWALQQVPVPAGLSEADLSGGVSCAEAARCVAVSEFGFFAELWNGARWRVLTTPAPAGSQDAGFHGIACFSGQACTAVGSYEDASEQTQALAERWNGTTWSIQATPAPAGTTLDGVSCPTASACTAVGDDGNPGVAEHWDGVSWSTQALPAPPKKAKRLNLTGVSCRASLSCTAIGLYGLGHPLAVRE